jgi:hypothetical protein
MPLPFLGLELIAMLAFSSFTSGVIVEVEGDREKVFARGPGRASLSSVAECQLDISYMEVVLRRPTDGRLNNVGETRDSL